MTSLLPGNYALKQFGSASDAQAIARGRRAAIDAIKKELTSDAILELTIFVRAIKAHLREEYPTVAFTEEAIEELVWEMLIFQSDPHQRGRERKLDSYAAADPYLALLMQDDEEGAL
jgi:hypothetical protein